MTICVTGGTGFIGRHFIKRCEREDGVKLKLLTRRPPEAKLLSANIQFVQGDLLDYESLLKFVDHGCVLVHLAYLFQGSRARNIEAVEYLAKACRAKGISRFVHLSSVGVTGPSADPIVTESTRCQPDSDYEVTKLELESLIVQLLGDACDVAMLRPTCVFGEGGDKVVKLVEDLSSDPAIVSYLKRSLFHRRRLNLVCAENVVEALWFLSTFKNALGGERFIVSDDDVSENNYLDVSDYLGKHLSIPQPSWPRVFFAPWLLPIMLKLTGRAARNPQTNYSSEKLSRLGYQSAIGFEDGLKLFVEWYKQQSNNKIAQ